MDDFALEIENLEALISLRQQEERRLGEIISRPQTAPEIRQQAAERLRDVLTDIQEDAKELARLKGMQ
jgi:hypothetical protein